MLSHLQPLFNRLTKKWLVKKFFVVREDLIINIFKMLSRFAKQAQRATSLQPLAQFEVRLFAAKKKKAKKEAGDVTEYESDQDAKQNKPVSQPIKEPVVVDQSTLKDY